ncbi:hypothetical protein X801_05586, partial [Opisthorchis viverrini]
MQCESMRFAYEIIERLKSQGLFDRIRKHCLEDIDLDSDYKFLQQRVNSFVSAFLQKQSKPIASEKLKLRERLRRELSNTSMLTTGVDRIVKNAVRTKLPRDFQDQIRAVVCESLGVDTNGDYSRDPTPKSFPAPTKDFANQPSPTNLPSTPALTPSFHPRHPPPNPEFIVPRGATALSTYDNLQPLQACTRTFVPPQYVVPPPGVYIPTIPPFVPQGLIAGPVAVSSTSAVPPAGPPAPPISTPFSHKLSQLVSSVVAEEASSLIDPPSTLDDATQCDDAMEIESSNSLSPIAETEHQPETNGAQHGLASQCENSQECQSYSTQVIWRGVRLELDDVSEDEVNDSRAKCRLSRVCGSRSPLSSGSTSPVASQLKEFFLFRSRDTESNSRILRSNRTFPSERGSSDEEYVPDLISDSINQDLLRHATFHNPSTPSTRSPSPGSLVPWSKYGSLHAEDRKADSQHRYSPSNSSVPSPRAQSTTRRYGRFDSPIDCAHSRKHPSRHHRISPEEHHTYRFAKLSSRISNSSLPVGENKPRPPKTITAQSKERFAFSTKETRPLQVYSDIDSSGSSSSCGQKSPTPNTSSSSIPSVSEDPAVALRKREIKARLKEIRHTERHLREDPSLMQRQNLAAERSLSRNNQHPCATFRRPQKSPHVNCAQRSPSSSPDFEAQTHLRSTNRTLRY